MDLPDRFFCPLTHQIMDQPTTAGDGYSYEKVAIENFIKQKGVSPITGKELDLNSLQENQGLKNEIDSIRDQITDENKFRDLKLIQQGEQIQQDQATQKDDQPKVQIHRFNDLVKISIQTPQGSQRSACDICCVIDVSGSMADEAWIKGSQGYESQGLSILDLVKHSVKTIINNLDQRDRLSIVAFHSYAYRVTQLTRMDEQGKAQAIEELEKLVPLDSTNIWDGIYQALEVIKAGQQDSIQSNEQRVAFSQVLLFTDGQPNVIPPRGHLPMLKKYKEENNVNCSISTFGFGYNLDSELLDELAVEGRGSFAFIPDGQFVGTVFVNALSNLMTTLAVDSVLCLENVNGSQFEEALIEEEQAKNILNREVVQGNHIYQRCSWGLNINIGSLQYGQSKDIVIRMKNINNTNGKPYINATLKFKTSSTAKSANEVSALSEDINQYENEVLVDSFRLESVEAILKSIQLYKQNKFEDSKDLIKQVINKINSHSLAKSNKFVKDLIQDLHGQVTIALSKEEYFQRWGRHYLLSLLRAHQIQQCNNFKDPGVQHYGGKLFEQMRDKADEMFLKMPPPKPSIQRSQNGPVQINMSQYYNNNAPCFDGNCLVKMVNGDFKKVMDIKKGDLIASPAINGLGAEVSCVIKTECSNSNAYLVEFEDGLIITPYHPIRVKNNWYFPCQLEETKLRDCEYIYSFVLEQGHTMEINGIECVTYAHNFEEQIVQHDYFGTHRIVKDLKRMQGWDNGLITLGTNCLVRDPITSLVVGLRQNNNIQKQKILFSDNQFTTV
ncbi:hypothetical protein ABPG72_012297 [Tetrahymena utriculariae]